MSSQCRAGLRLPGLDDGAAASSVARSCRRRGIGRQLSPRRGSAAALFSSYPRRGARRREAVARRQRWRSAAVRSRGSPTPRAGPGSRLRTRRMSWRFLRIYRATCEQRGARSEHLPARARPRRRGRPASAHVRRVGSPVGHPRGRRGLREMAVVHATGPWWVGEFARMLGRDRLRLADEARVSSCYLRGSDRGAGSRPVGMAWGVQTIVDEALEGQRHRLPRKRRSRAAAAHVARARSTS